MKCSKCGKELTKSYGGLCQACYRYYHDGGTDNPIPEPGTIAYDHRGYVVCHICGRAFKRLGSHAKESHNMSVAEYKEKFELCKNARTTEKNYAQRMHDLAYKYRMPEQLQETGKITRFQPGEQIRLGKKVRLQECLDKSRRYQKNG